MHPDYTSDRPGDAPCCGMRLTPVYAGTQTDKAGPAITGSAGMVQVSASRQQLIGVRTDKVERAPVSHSLRVPGRITVDESRLYRITGPVDGWVREIGANTAGTFVKRDQVLASFYAREFLPAQQTLLYVMIANDQAPAGPASPRPAQYVRPQLQSADLTIQNAIDALHNLGVSDPQIEEFKRTRSFASNIQLCSPTTGFVLARNISPGQRFEKGDELYRVADIGHLWVMTDIFEKDQAFVRPGVLARVRYEGREFHARMADVLPQFDAQSRTLKTRFEVDNAGNVLRPDVFVDVEIQVHLPETVTVPADAVLETGRRSIVYVDLADGHFEPRTVETGWRLGNRVQITHGLEPGERIVVSGNFLIDSESRMQLARVSAAPAAATDASPKDPVCGMDVDPKKPNAIKTEYGGKTYYFCSNHCKKTFDANPEKYPPKAMSAQDGSAPRGPA
jgi:multidrug efflux pump subunit AcrA (membrane-fusion protein)/YHS domain-containing protein